MGSIELGVGESDIIRSKLFDGKRIVITGAARDTGFQLASVLASLGGNVVVTARKLELAEAAASSIPGDLESVEIDLSHPVSIENGCASIVAAGKVDILINNGAMWLSGPLDGHSTQEIVEVIGSCVTGSVLMLRALLPGLRASAAPDIVTICSTAGLVHAQQTSAAIAFHAAKAGQSAMVETARQEFAAERIRFSVIYPPDLDHVPIGPHGGSRSVCNKVTSRDVADAVVFALTRPRSVGFLSLRLESFAP